MTKCPNCNNNTYIETPELESYSSCEMACFYHGSGPNKIYNEMMEQESKYFDSDTENHS